MNISAVGWLSLVLILCVSTFGASCVIAIVLGFLAFIIGLLTVLYVQSGNFEDVYFSCNLLNNPLAVQEIPAGGLGKIVERLKKPKIAQKTDQRVTGSDLIDSSLQEIFGYIIRDYVQPWYSLISTDSEFIECGVRKSAQTLAIHISNRVKEIDWLPYLTTRLVDDAATQLRLFRGARARLDAAAPRAASSPKHRRNKSDTDVSHSTQDTVEQHFFTLEAEEGQGRGAVCTEAAREAAFLASLTELLMYVLLPDQDFRCAPLRALLRHLAAHCLLRPLVDQAVDPDNINHGLLWLCVRDATLSSDAFLTALRLTEDVAELRHVRDLVARELQQLRGRDTAASDAAVKQQLGSLQYVSRLLDTRLTAFTSTTSTSLCVPSATSSTTAVHLPLDTLLKNNIALSYFIDYMTSVGRQAGLFFYLAVEGWRAAAEQQLAAAADPAAVRDSARRLCAQYLPQLGAPAPLLRALHQRVHDPAQSPSDLWFDDVQRHVLDEMRADVAGFERSAGYAAMLSDLDLDLLEDTSPPPPARHNKHARSYSDITCHKSQQSTTTPHSSDVNDTEDYAKLKVGNFSLSVDIIEAGVMSEKGKTFGIYATQVSKLYESGLLEQWHVYRRYSDFHELQARVRERWPDLARLPFPGKKPFHNAERALLERRMRALNAYMGALCRRPDPALRALLLTFTEHGDYRRDVTATLQPPLDDTSDNNIPLRVLLVLADEVFDLRSRNQWLRRRLVTLLRQVVRAWFGDIVSRRIVEWVAAGTSPRNVARGLRGLQRAVWPGGERAPPRPARGAAQRARTRLAAKVALLAAPALPDELQRLLGADTTRRGLLTVFDLTQRPQLTRRLLYVLLEGAIAHLLPEKPVPQLLRQLYTTHTHTHNTHSEYGV